MEHRRLRVIVVGAEDVAEHLRSAGHRVLSLAALPVMGMGTADVAVLELGPGIDARCAQRFRVKLVEPVLIYRRPTERARAFLCIRRRPNGVVRLDLVSKAVKNAAMRTELLREIEGEDSVDVDAPTEVLTLELKRPQISGRLAERAVMARPLGEEK